MRNLYRYLKNTALTALSVVALNACVSLEEEPIGILAPDSFYKTESDFQAGLNGMLSPMWVSWGGYSFNWGVFQIPGAMADDIATAPHDAFLQFDRFNYDPNNGQISNLWGIHYAVINNANILISNLETTSVISEEKKAHLLGQAKFWRANSYFILTQWFGEVPIITTENRSNADKVGQSPVADVYDAIVLDLQDAESTLPPSFPERIRPTSWAAKSLLSKVYLTMAGWPLKEASAYKLARDKAKEVMDGSSYALEADFKDLWIADNGLTNSEFIFFFKGVNSGGWPNPGASFYHHASRHPKEAGWGDFFSEATFYNNFPDGYRKDVSFTTSWPDGTSFPADVAEPFVAKYRDAGSEIISYEGTDLTGVNSEGYASYVHMRFADVLLIFAEADNQVNGPTGEAYEAINQVRRRALNQDIYTPDPAVDLSGLSKEAFDKAVIDERAWELAFEEKRWFDLVRKELIVEVKGVEYPHINQNFGHLPKPALEVEQIEGLEQNTY
ncbi:RagB/SusD family nutrient uptake outer membrane protein [Flammeovirga pacifica]|uniref:RagB/SusD family nutrient uptake outer membrane protein n=1 Tax=Flammeovirga pacifica TaxID=915059 RepID=A0A1S1YUZ2_FLAPC|nr:RagB/SusD family nutrient uptake outer membrane protein [Flammeovirga pacifica]OHX64645.1 hypothetical protein NH26_24045 [Flammeovirga pacifica]